MAPVLGSTDGRLVERISKATHLQTVGLGDCSKVTEWGFRSLRPLPELSHLSIDQRSADGTRQRDWRSRREMFDLEQSLPQLQLGRQQ